MPDGRFALIVASSHYADMTLTELQAPAHDAASLAAVLGADAIGGFHVETLADQPSTTTDTMELGQFETQLESTVTLTDRAGIQRDLTDDEIERAIAEIQSTIQKYRK